MVEAVGDIGEGLADLDVIGLVGLGITEGEIALAFSISGGITSRLTIDLLISSLAVDEMEKGFRKFPQKSYLIPKIF